MKDLIDQVCIKLHAATRCRPAGVPFLVEALELARTLQKLVKVSEPVGKVVNTEGSLPPAVIIDLDAIANHLPLGTWDLFVSSRTVAKEHFNGVPDFSALRDKRMSELTPEQREDARELWLRDNLRWMPEYHAEFYRMLLNRLDALRGSAACPECGGTRQVTDTENVVWPCYKCQPGRPSPVVKE